MTISKKDVKIVFFMHGVYGVKDLCEEQNPSANVVRKACSELEDDGVDVSDLKVFVEANFHKESKPRKTKPSVGETRTYRAQTKGKEVLDDPFIRVPVEFLGVGKGGGIDVTFQDGQIVLRPNEGQEEPSPF